MGRRDADDEPADQGCDRAAVRFGRDVLFWSWIAREKETLDALHRAGANVPRPITQLSTAFLMSWIGDEEEAAPQLRQVRFDDPVKAARILDFLVGQVEVWLAHDVVHADLSEYNVLFWRGRPVVIDFPEAIDPRFNRNAYTLLQRDVGDLVRHFERFGVRRDAHALAAAMWERWLHSDAWLGIGVQGDGRPGALPTTTDREDVPIQIEKGRR